MKSFHYRALSAEGQLMKGSALAGSLSALERHLGKLGLELLSARSHRASFSSDRSLPAETLCNFFFSLAQLLQAGISLQEALECLQENPESTYFSALVQDLLDGLQQGRSFSVALQSHPELFDPVTLALLAAGEHSGQLAGALSQVGQRLEWQWTLKRKLRQTLSYPLFSLVLVVAATYFLVTQVLPQVEQFSRMSGQKLPGYSQWFLTLARVFIENAKAIFAGFFSITLLTITLYRRHPVVRRQLDSFSLKVPLIGPILLEISLARFTQTLATLYGAGVDLQTALPLSKVTLANHHLEAAANQANEAIQTGASLYQAFAANTRFPALFLRMMQVGETTGRLELALGKCALLYQENIQRRTQKLERTLEPAITLITALLLGWTAMTLFGPLYDALGNLK